MLNVSESNFRNYLIQNSSNSKHSDESYDHDERYNSKNPKKICVDSNSYEFNLHNASLNSLY